MQSPTGIGPKANDDRWTIANIWFMSLSMVTATIVLLYLAYSIPVVLLLIRGRNSIEHAWFYMGRVGLFANIVLLLWTCFTLVMYSFPYTQPVNAGSKSTPAPPHPPFFRFRLWPIRPPSLFKIPQHTQLQIPPTKTPPKPHTQSPKTKTLSIITTIILFGLWLIMKHTKQRHELHLRRLRRRPQRHWSRLVPSGPKAISWPGGPSWRRGCTDGEVYSTSAWSNVKEGKK